MRTGTSLMVLYAWLFMDVFQHTQTKEQEPRVANWHDPSRTSPAKIGVPSKRIECAKNHSKAESALLYTHHRHPSGHLVE